MHADQPLDVLTAHDAWATDQIIQACRSLSDPNSSSLKMGREPLVSKRRIQRAIATGAAQLTNIEETKK